MAHHEPLFKRTYGEEIMKKLGLSKRILRIWETICYGCLIGYGIRLLLSGVNEEWILFLCLPTVLLMVHCREFILSDKVMWERYKTYEWILPLVVFIAIGVHQLFKRSSFCIFVLGVIIPYILLIIVAFTTKNKKEKENA